MLLAVDIGNSNIVFGLKDSGKWLNHWRIQTDPNKTSDEYGVIFHSLLSIGNQSKIRISSIIICSVVPTLVDPIKEMLEELLKIKASVFGAIFYDMLPVKVLNPNQIGTDLVANSVAAYSKYGGNSMVIDFGTALTFTTINADAEILGVAIAPGLKTAVRSLASNTAQLPFVQLETPPSVLGDTTEHAIQAGVVVGYCGLIESIIEKSNKELGVKLKVIATGGLSQKFAPMINGIQYLEPMLTLDGLSIINKLIS